MAYKAEISLEVNAVGELRATQCIIRIREREDHTGFVFMCSEKISTMSFDELTKLNLIITKVLVESQATVSVK